MAVEPQPPVATVVQAAFPVGSNAVTDNGGDGVSVDATDAPRRGLSVVGNQVASTDGTQRRGVVLAGDVSEALVAANGVTGDHEDGIRNESEGDDVAVESNLA
jgi:hypothetical protein